MKGTKQTKAIAAHFESVGREKRSWVAPLADVPRDDMEEWDGVLAPSDEWLAKEAKRGGGLMSRDVFTGPDTTHDGQQRRFTIFAGLRPVGTGWIEVSNV